MAIFQNPLWGFELTYPDEWVQQTKGDVDGFAENAEAFDHTDAEDEPAAHLLVRGEWNGRREPIAPLWDQHITKLSVMLGAKQVGSSPFSMGGANGFEAEILLPKRKNRRLWAGILAHDTTILHFMVSHPKEERVSFEPQATQIISSVRFLKKVNGVSVNEENLPLPPNYHSEDPVKFLPDINPDESWKAYAGTSDLGALQAYYYRELPNFGWEISEFIPYPNQVNVSFARIRIHKNDLTATLGLLPTTGKKPFGHVVIKYET
ncbi:MAG: hypothetical protein AB8I58_20345 [Anaerolineales bacterium]